MDAAAKRSAEGLHDRVFRRLIGQVRARERETGAAEYAIDNARYVSPERHAAERERVLLASPIPVVRSTLLAEPGDTLAFDDLGVPALLMRNARGEIGAFLNMCRHRAARLVPRGETPCRLKSVVCPYHGWTYATDGSLRGVPLEEGFDRLPRAERGLVPLPVAERHGFIWLAGDRRASFDIDAWLGEMADGMRAFGVEGDVQFTQSRRIVRANWKLLIDGFLEIYHVSRLHKDTVGRYFVDTMMASERVGRHLCAALARGRIEEVERMPEEDWRHRRDAVFLYHVFPNSIFFFSPGFANHLVMYPQGPGETLVVDTMLVPHAPRDRKQRKHWTGKFHELDEAAFHGEDFAMGERMQEGMAAMPDGEIAIGRYESAIKGFHDVLDRELAG